MDYIIGLGVLSYFVSTSSPSSSTAFSGTFFIYFYTYTHPIDEFINKPIFDAEYKKQQISVQ